MASACSSHGLMAPRYPNLPVVELGRWDSLEQLGDMHKNAIYAVGSTCADQRTLWDTSGQGATRRATGPAVCRTRPLRSSQQVNVEEVGRVAVKPAHVLTADEAADYLRVSRKTLYRLVSASKIPGQKVGWSWRFRRADLVAFLGAPK